jgi:hypothetical protein
VEYRPGVVNRQTGGKVVTFVLWCILFVLCWPLAIVALVLYPIVWVLLIPFRLLGIAVGAVLDLVWVVVTLPVRVLRILMPAR